MRKERIFISGVNGFIGTHLTKHFNAHGHQVVGVGRNTTCTVSDINYFQDNCATSKHLSEYARGCTIFIHLAATTTHHDIVGQPVTTFQTNWQNTFNILEAFAKVGAKHFFYPSSVKVYGMLTAPFREDMHCQPQSILGKYKYVGERLVDFFSDLHRDRIFSIGRIFNVYGKGQKENFVIPAILKQIQLGTEQIMLGDIKAKRDYIYITDVVSAVETIINRNHIPGISIFNIGTGVATSVEEIVDIFSKITKHTLVPVSDQSQKRRDETDIEYGNCKRLECLGWRAQISLPAGLTQLVNKL